MYRSGRCSRAAQRSTSAAVVRLARGAILAGLVSFHSSLALGKVLAPGPEAFAALRPDAQHWVQTVTVLSGGFIVTSLLWGTGLAKLIDGKVRAAAGTFALGAIFALFGIIHSPLPSAQIVTPARAMELAAEAGRGAATRSQTPYHWAAAYLAIAGVILAIGRVGTRPGSIDEEPDDVL